MKKKVLCIGATKGLGEAVLRHGVKHVLDTSFYCVSRTPPREKIQDVNYLHFDMSVERSLDQLLSEIEDIRPHRIFYFPGGGPFGLYTKNRWASQLWALQVTLLSPMKLLHKVACFAEENRTQLIFVGSKIADQEADPNGPSYSAAKHGLRGFINSLGGQPLPFLDIRLFRPGYMDTAMVPKKAAVRQKLPLENPDELAALYWNWALDKQGRKVFSTQGPGQN